MGKMTRAGLNVVCLSLFVVSLGSTCWAEDEAASNASGEKTIREALDRSVSPDFKDTQLKDVVAYLRDHEKINVQFDIKPLAAVGTKPDVHITFSAESISLRSALNEMLRALDLTWVIKDDVLWITTPDRASEILSTRVYDVADLVVVPNDEGTPSVDFESLISLITETVAPTTWDEVGGPGALRESDNGSLLVMQKDEVHDRIVALLSALREAKRRTDKDPGQAIPAVSEREAAAEAAISKKLGQTVSVKWEATPMSKFVGMLHEQYALPIQLDERALDEAQINIDAMLKTFEANDVALDDAIRGTLSRLELVHVIHNELLVITTPDAAAEVLQIRAYPIGDLMEPHDTSTKSMFGKRLMGASALNAPLFFSDNPFESLIAGITQTIAPTTWSEVGGPASITEFTHAHCLVIVQTRDAHRVTAQLLVDLRASHERQKAELDRLVQSQAAAKSKLHAAVYVLIGKTPDGLTVSGEEVAKFIVRTVEPESWKADKVEIQTAANRLFVRQTSAVQIQIGEMLLRMQLLAPGGTPSNLPGSMGGMGMGGMGGMMGGQAPTGQGGARGAASQRANAPANQAPGKSGKGGASDDLFE